MGEKQLEKALETLESLNDAVLAARLHPASAPQAIGTFKRALQNVSNYIGVYHQLHCGCVNDQPVVQGEPVPADKRKTVEGYVIFSQLTLLDLPHLLLGLDFSEDLLRKLLYIFTSRKEKIAREGGGRAFVEKMGLLPYFPSTIESSQSESVSPRRKKLHR